MSTQQFQLIAAAFNSMNVEADAFASGLIDGDEYEGRRKRIFTGLILDLLDNSSAKSERNHGLALIH